MDAGIYYQPLIGFASRSTALASLPELGVLYIRTYYGKLTIINVPVLIYFLFKSLIVADKGR
jgi:hypothetical protein